MNRTMGYSDLICSSSKERLTLLLSFGLLLVTLPGHGDDSLPGAGFDAQRYDSLATNSPFSVAAPEAGETSPEYQLVGIAHFDGTDYASVIDKQTNDRLLLWRGKESPRDASSSAVALISITEGKSGGESSALVVCNGQRMLLKIEKTEALAVAKPATSKAMVSSDGQVRRHFIFPPSPPPPSP